ncbi:hypothetical protein NDU88_003325 [Pleurodeles waltl]|uniref:Uncharacterized protein n=1 Tax=Pleurodeles waltl TaxID=8319 RepID=A0AAV7M6M1_PLEWA|nr:hypothetical protein NDU88_003325 [Pleurodeles waltl]
MAHRAGEGGVVSVLRRWTPVVGWSLRPRPCGPAWCSSGERAAGHGGLCRGIEVAALRREGMALGPQSGGGLMGCWVARWRLRQVSHVEDPHGRGLCICRGTGPWPEAIGSATAR